MVLSPLRIAISGIDAVSLNNQKEILAKFLRSKGFRVRSVRGVSIYEILNNAYDVYIWFVVFNPTWIIDIATAWLMCKRYAKGVPILYTTIEGVPQKWVVQSYATRYVEVIANSYFTKKMLEKAEVPVIDVIHHAIDFELVEEAKKTIKYFEKQIRERHKDKVVFCFVGREDPRKGIDAMLTAVNKVAQKYRDKFVVLMVVNASNPEKYSVPNVELAIPFGEAEYTEILAFMGACDYLLFPSYCEGFGLPVLESMAMGRPVVHAWFEPLSEFSHKEANITFDYEYEQYVRPTPAHSADQFFLYHVYDVNELAHAIEYAIDIKLNYPSEYEDRCAKVREHAKKWDVKKVYKKFLNYLPIKTVQIEEEE